jgi:hypothetical protein
VIEATIVWRPPAYAIRIINGTKLRLGASVGGFAVFLQLAGVRRRISSRWSGYCSSSRFLEPAS